MKALVTGATGFLGGWLTRELIKQGWSVRILRRSNSDISELSDLPIDHAIGDVTDLPSVNVAAKGMDVVFHLAGVVGYSRAMRELMDRVNVTGTKNVIDGCLSNNVRRMIHLSSVVAVGASFDGKSPLTEESRYNVSHLNLGYFETKRQAELLVMDAVKNRKLDAVALNPSTIYGAGDAKKGSRKTQLKVAQGQFPFYTGGGVNVIAVEDVVQAIIAAVEKGRRGQRYILANENLLIKDLFRIIAAEAGVSPPRIYLPNAVVMALGRVGDALESIGKKGPINSENAWTSTLFHWFDSTKAQNELGLSPRPARQAIANSVGWMKEHGLLEA